MSEPRVEPSIAGTSVRDMRVAYESLVGADLVARAIATLPDEHRRLYEEATHISWVPTATVGLLHDAIVAGSGRDSDPLLDQVVRMATDRTFKTVWRLLLRFTSDDALIARTPMMYAKSRNVGRLELRASSEGRATWALVGWPDITDRNLRSLGVSIETILQLCGRRKATVDWVRAGGEIHIRVALRT